MSIGYEYGNARLAARRARFLGSESIRELGQARGPGEFLALLAHEPDWRAVRRGPAAPGADARAAAEDLVERWRAAGQTEVLRHYDPPIRRLVEVLVMPLDAERIIEILRRRRAGSPPDEVDRSLPPGALLGEGTLGSLLRTPSDAALFRGLGEIGFIARDAAHALAALAEGRAGFPDPDARAAAVEVGFRRAIEHARGDRAQGRGADAAEVRAILAAEAADRDAVAAEMAVHGPTPAAVLERTLALERWATHARRAHRDPLGIGPVVAFVAAVELTAVRLRAVLARVAGAWHDEQLAACLVGVVET